MNVGDIARISRGPWRGFKGRVTATFTGGWVSVSLAGFERTFAADEVELDDAGNVVEPCAGVTT